MRALGLSLAVLALVLTSGGVAMRPAAEEAAVSEAAEQTAPEQGQCREHRSPRATTTKIPGPDPNRPTSVRALNTGGYNYRDPQPGQPGPVAVPASPER